MTKAPAPYLPTEVIDRLRRLEDLTKVLRGKSSWATFIEKWKVDPRVISLHDEFVGVVTAMQTHGVRIGTTASAVRVFIEPLVAAYLTADKSKEIEALDIAKQIGFYDLYSCVDSETGHFVPLTNSSASPEFTESINKRIAAYHAKYNGHWYTKIDIARHLNGIEVIDVSEARTASNGLAQRFLRLRQAAFDAYLAPPILGRRNNHGALYFGVVDNMSVYNNICCDLTDEADRIKEDFGEEFTAFVDDARLFIDCALEERTSAFALYRANVSQPTRNARRAQEDAHRRAYTRDYTHFHPMGTTCAP